MSFPQLGYPQYLSASQAVYGSDRPGVLTPSSRGGSTEIGGSPSATAAAVTSVLGMYASPYAHNYSAFLPYTSADLALFSQMVSRIYAEGAQMIVSMSLEGGDALVPLKTKTPQKLPLCLALILKYLIFYFLDFVHVCL